ncbi:Ltp family lipoprotein [Agromyces laixinhei]|uniref:Ltp family lipoprotein n=1 Tax=Agromyces laixinhei TaxID=2585717 RepID=UPI0018DB0BC0|nr:Ltp family lipoprotein [Agromyces laixinhei]
MTDTQNPQPEPQHVVGDEVNGHRLTQTESGTLEWLPVPGAGFGAGQPTSPEPTEHSQPPKGRTLPVWAWIVIGVVAVLTVIGGIGAIGNANRSDTAAPTPSVATTRAQPAEAKKPEPSAEPEMVTIGDYTGQTAEYAAAALKSLGLEASYATAGDATVNGTVPAAGTVVEAGTAVTIDATEKPKLTLAQQNALKTAGDYIAYMPFSRQGLIDQMTSEYGSGYDVETATWAVDSLAIDYNAQAAKAAQQYLDLTGFSRDGLFEQLTSEYGGQYTPEQANAGLAAVGY